MENFDTFTEDLTRCVLYQLGFEVRNGIIVGENKQLPIIFNNKYMSYDSSINGFNKNVTPFNPIFNPKLAQFLFQIFLKQWQIDNFGRNVIQSFYLTPVNEDGYGQAVCKYEDCITYASSLNLSNETLRYIDLLLRLSESNDYNDAEMMQYDLVLRQKKIDGEC